MGAHLSVGRGRRRRAAAATASAAAATASSAAALSSAADGIRMHRGQQAVLEQWQRLLRVRRKPRHEHRRERLQLLGAGDVPRRLRANARWRLGLVPVYVHPARLHDGGAASSSSANDVPRPRIPIYRQFLPEHAVLLVG